MFPLDVALAPGFLLLPPETPLLDQRFCHSRFANSSRCPRFSASLSQEADSEMACAFCVSPKFLSHYLFQF